MGYLSRRQRVLAPMLAALTVLATACGDAEADGLDSVTTGDERVSEHMVAIVDLSSSVTEGELSRHRQLLAEVVQSLSFGDRLVVLTAHAKGRRDGTPPAVLEMPGARNSARPARKEEIALETAKRIALQSTSDVFEGERANGTDIFASLHTAADHLRGSERHSRSLLIMSDMLQCANGVCMERKGGVPNAEWIEDQQAAGVLPDLSGVCISAVGPDPSTEQGVRIRDFWKAYFAAAGASFSPGRYRHTIPEVALLHCT